MSYLNTTYEIYNKKEKKGITFVIKEEEGHFFLVFSINENGVVSIYENIILEKSSNHIYRTQEILIHQDMNFKEYKVLKVKFMLKFKNNDLSPVSTIFLHCLKNNRDRIFNLSILDATELGYVIRPL